MGATFTNITGTLQTVAQPNITSLGTLGALTVSGNVNANGNIVGDNATNVSGINSVTATTLFGDGSNLTGITAEGTGAIGGLTVKNQSGSVVGTGGSISTLDFNGSTGVTVTATSGAAGIATIAITGGFSADADGNLLAGTNAGEDLDGTSGCCNVFIGQCAGQNATSGHSNVFLGVCAGGNGTLTGQHNIAGGTFAGKSIMYYLDLTQVLV